MAWLKSKHTQKKFKEKRPKMNRSSEFYNNKAWHRLRNSYINRHPLCERCLMLDKVTPAEHVHHIEPFLRGKTIEDKWKLFLNEDNLMAVCSRCHRILHEQLNNS